MAQSSTHFIVVGGGHAAGQLLESIRKEGFTGKLTLVSEERLLPYQRPHLSKLYLAGTLSEEKLLYRPAEFYKDNDIDVILNQRVESISAGDKSVKLVDESSLKYDKLALTIGARIRELPVPGMDLNGVYYLRTVQDTDYIRDALAEAENVVLIGGGFLGLEAASVLINQGKKVTVLEMQERVMATAVAPEVSHFYEQLHASKGVDIRTNVQVESIESGDKGLKQVLCKDGSSFPADIVIVSIGIIPNVELAQKAGLACDNGIIVDEYARTSDSNIVAAGDCTKHPNGFLNRNLRLESVHNAVEQAKTAAASMCDMEKVYQQVPWFWSDQYDYRLQMVGVPDSNDQAVVRGEISEAKFSVWFFNNGQLTGCHAVNRPNDYMSCRKLMENGLNVSPEQAVDSSFNFKNVLPKKAPLAFQNR